MTEDNGIRAAASTGRALRREVDDLTPSSDWQVSSFCGEGANCLNVAAAFDGLRLRESEDPETAITLKTTSLRSLLAAVKADAGDLPHQPG